MRVSNIKNVSKKGVTLKTVSKMEIFLPPEQEFEDIDVTNLKKLGEKVSYVSDLTEVNRGKRGRAVLHS